jgi:hypothetical protein
VIRLKQLRWLHMLLIAALGALGPALAWQLDPFLRFRVQMWGDRSHPIAHLAFVLWTSAADRPFTVLGFMLPPVLALNALLWYALLGPRASPRDSPSPAADHDDPAV